MIYGIWTIVVGGTDYWAGGGMADTLIKEFGYKKDNCGTDFNAKFQTMDINFAYRYMEYLTNYYVKTNHNYIFEVRER